MPEKRPEVVEDPDASPPPPDITEGSQTTETGDERREDRKEDKIDTAEERHEKAHRRKRARTRF
jgi:hypothetical protein